MDKLLALACFLFGIVIVVTTFPEGNAAVFVAALLTVVTVYVITFKIPEDRQFLIRIFLVAVLARLAFGLFLHTFELREFFGGDAVTYDNYGNLLMQSWFGDPSEFSEIRLERRLGGVGWGMLYLVGSIYSFTGRNILAAQFFCAVVGAAISPLLYFCSYTIFNNRRVSRVSAVLAALFPAFIIWTGQLLKDGLVVFLIVLIFVTKGLSSIVKKIEAKRPKVALATNNMSSSNTVPKVSADAEIAAVIAAAVAKSRE